MSGRLSRFLELASNEKADIAVLVPGPNMYYLTGLSMGQSERVTLLILGLRSRRGAWIIPLLEASKAEKASREHSDGTTSLSFKVFPYSDEQGPLEATRNALNYVSPQECATALLEERYARLLEYRLLERATGGLTWRDMGPLLAGMRVVKDDLELGYIQRACLLADEGAKMAHELVRPGKSTLDIAAEIEFQLRRQGAEVVSLSLAAGAETAVPHARTSGRVIEDGELVWLDLTVRVGGYWGDITRTYVTGKIQERLKEAYLVVLEAQEYARNNILPGMTCEEADRLARNLIASKGYGEYFTHRTGHGLGLEIHEEPYIVATNTSRLEQGMVFTVEPGIYIPGLGGIRIEDDVMITETGAESLTSYPRNLLQ